MKNTLVITDDFDARSIYNRMRAYSRGIHNRAEIRFETPLADRTNHQWEEENMEFLNLKTKIKLTYRSSPCKHPEGQLATHTLKMEISGKEEDREDTIREIEIITGIKKIKKYIIK